VSAESHEWERIQAGVFSHEVRSGLLGGADLDGDGGVSYREIAAFIERANSAIPNERFRPRLMARPPIGTPMLLEPPSQTRQRATTEWALEIDGKLSHGHHVLEDANGVRVLEFNNAPGVSLRLRRLPGLADTFLRKEGSTTEYRIPADEPVIALADVGETETRTTSRGAKHESFELLFKNSLAPEHVSGVELTPPPPIPGPEFPYYKVAEWSAVGGALTLFALAVSSNLRAMDLRDSTTVSASQAEAARRDKRIDDYNTRALALYAGGAVLSALATWLFITEE
jgi:hypothetical protein